MRITYAMRILAHLDRYKNGSDNGYTTRWEVTQEGIADGVGIDIAIIRVNLSRLLVREDIEWAWRRVGSERNRRKAYWLTQKGYERIRMLPVTVGL